MDTDTPSDPQGVPFHVALETLLEKHLVEALRAAGAAPLAEAPKVRTSDWWKGGRTYPVNDAVRRDHLLHPPRKALLDALRRELAAGHILCAGREKGAGAADHHTFAPSDWQHPETLRTSNWRSAAARINGRVYVDLLFWRRAASESRHAATSLSTGNAMENGTTPMFPAPADQRRTPGAKPGFHPANQRKSRLPIIELAKRDIDAGQYASIRRALLAHLDLSGRQDVDGALRPYREDMKMLWPDWYEAKSRRGH